jgi:hypothetical protein
VLASDGVGVIPHRSRYTTSAGKVLVRFIQHNAGTQCPTCQIAGALWELEALFCHFYTIVLMIVLHDWPPQAGYHITVL